MQEGLIQIKQSLQQARDIIKRVSKELEMFIQSQKYCWNSLRKGRLLGFQNDVQQAFTAFKNHMLQPEEITVKVFQSIADSSQFVFLVHCRAEEEDQEEYIQLLYQIIIDNYFMSQNQAKQVFSIYALYFLYCQLERKRRVNVDTDFLEQFLIFLKKNTSKSDRHWMMIAKKLMQSCFSIGIKTGLKTYLIKPNGEPARKGKYHVIPARKMDAKIQPDDHQKEQQREYLNTLKYEISSLQMNLQSYSKGRQKFNFELQNSQNRLLYSDKNLGIRLIKKYNQYQKLLNEKNNQQ